MPDPSETALPALWQKFLNEVVERTKAVAPTPDAGDTYRALQLFLDVEERAVRLAGEKITQTDPPLPYIAVDVWLAVATAIARHLRTRLGLPADPPNLDSRPGAGLP